jgi:branched-chain amino acid transport system permease protein
VIHALAIQTLNGLSFGALLFLIAAGLSLIYGLMKILNLTHGSYYLLGGYIALTVMRATGSFVAAIVAATVIVAVIGVCMERFLLRRFHMAELPQTLLTFGFVFLFADQALVIWGGNPETLPKPAAFAGVLHFGGTVYPTYRLFLMFVGAFVGLVLWWFQEQTRFGAMLRAAVDDREIADALGINVSLLFTLVFALGAFLAALGGVLGAPILGVYPGADFEVLLLAFAVVIVGGLGSLKGAFIGALLVGLIDTYGKAYFPDFAPFSIFVPIVIVLAIRPTGMFGRP